MVVAEEERDSMVPGHGGEGRADGGDSVDPTAATTWRWTGWRRRRRRGHGKFWLADNVQVKILQLWFKDQETRSFIGGPHLRRA
jgi:hypothetical protein